MTPPVPTNTPPPTPKGFITFTYANKPVTVAIHSIGSIEPAYDISGKPQSTITLTFGSGGKTVFGGARETYEELLRLIAAQAH